jgi:hypothetical protein
MDTLLKNKKYRNSLVAIAVIIIAVIGWLFFTSQKTYPLGDKLEYVGKQDYGCWLVCDSNPASTYYYATDMTIEDMTQVFKNASQDSAPQTSSTTIDNQDVAVKWLSFKTTSGQSFYVNFYSDPSQLVSHYHFSTTHKYIISIGSESYPAAEKGL